MSIPIRLTLIFLFIACVPSFYAQETNSGVYEITCPCMIEYEFPGSDESFFYQLNGGVPIIRLSEAKIKDNKTLVCVYEREFASGNLYTETKGFTFWGDDCQDAPLYLTMNPLNLEKYAPGFSMAKDVKIQKTYSGYVFYNLECSELGEDAYCWHGAIYKKKLTSDSDPNLYMEMEGVAKVNEDETGFICAGSIAELYGNDGDDVMLSPGANSIKKVKPVPPFMKDKKHIKKKKLIKKKENEIGLVSIMDTN